MSICWKSSQREHPRVELSLDEGKKNIIISPYQLCGGKIDGEQHVKSDGLSSMTHSVDKTFIEVAPPSIVDCICKRLWTTSISVLSCCTMTANCWASAITIGCEDLSSIDGSGRSFWQKDYQVELVKIFWALIFIMMIEFSLPTWHANLLQPILECIWLRWKAICKICLLAKIISDGDFPIPKSVENDEWDI